MRYTRSLTLALLALAALSTAHAQSIEAVIDGVRERVKEELTFRQIDNLEPGDVEALLTEEEKRILGGAYLTFEVNVPVVVSVFRDMRLEEDGEPFWLRERGFRRTEFRAEAYQEDFDVWQKAFPAGEVGLGVHALRVVREHYFVAVAPQNPEAELRITNLNPEPHTLGTVELGELIYVDRDVTLDAVSEPLVGQTLIRTESDRRPVAAVYGYYRLTDHPATPEPDQIALTWSGDPKTTQTVQWRTSTETQTGAVRYLKKSDFNRFEPQGPTRVEAQTTVLESPKTVNDLTVHRHTATLTGLEPGTSYVYAVGDGSEDGWSELYEFTTAPEGESAFSFIYLGDAQNGLDRFGSLLKAAHRERPDAAFYVMAGDLVDRGNERDDWDAFFENTAGHFENRTLVTAIGNHETQDGHPQMYLDTFALPENSPKGTRSTPTASPTPTPFSSCSTPTSTPRPRPPGWTGSSPTVTLPGSSSSRTTARIPRVRGVTTGASARSGLPSSKGTAWTWFFRVTITPTCAPTRCKAARLPKTARARST